MKKVITIAIFLFLSFNAFTQNVNDTTTVNRISEQRLQEYASDNDFAYIKQNSNPEDTWFAYILNRITQWLVVLRSNGIMGTIFKIVLYLIVIAAFLLIVFKLTDLSFSKILYKDKGIKASWNPVDKQTIYDIDFDHLIDKALSEQHYNLAIRYHFRKMLQMLSETGAIRWKPHKKNRDYYHEIEDQELKDRFRKLYRFFEYVWYGDFPVSEKSYRKIAEEFNQMKTKLNYE